MGECQAYSPKDSKSKAAADRPSGTRLTIQVGAKHDSEFKELSKTREQAVPFSSPSWLRSFLFRTCMELAPAADRTADRTTAGTS